MMRKAYLVEIMVSICVSARSCAWKVEYADEGHARLALGRNEEAADLKSVSLDRLKESSALLHILPRGEPTPGTNKDMALRRVLSCRNATYPQ